MWADHSAKSASLWHTTGLGGRIGERAMKRAVPVRMPKWSESHFPNSKQLQTYLLFWERQRKPLEPDPGAGLYQKSFWLDPEGSRCGCLRGRMFPRCTTRSGGIHSPDSCLSQRNAGSARCFERCHDIGTTSVANFTINSLDSATSPQGRIHSREFFGEGTQPSRGQLDITLTRSRDLLATGKHISHGAYCKR